MTKRVNVTFDGQVVGTAEVDDESRVVEFELEPDEMKFLFPEYNPTEGIFASTMPVDLSSVYYKNRRKESFQHD